MDYLKKAKTELVHSEEAMTVEWATTRALQSIAAALIAREERERGKLQSMVCPRYGHTCAYYEEEK